MITIITNKVASYCLYKSKLFTLYGEFSKWNNGVVQEIKFKLTNGDRTYQIEDVNFCVENKRLEIHIFKSDIEEDTFTATYKNLKEMSLKPRESRNLDFIDYFKDSHPVLEDCFKPPTSPVGSQPEVKKGSILVGQ